jgi:hypothetical protein
MTIFGVIGKQFHQISASLIAFIDLPKTQDRYFFPFFFQIKQQTLWFSVDLIAVINNPK